MRAIVQDRYGPPETLKLAEVDRPPVPDEAVLVRVKASSVNAVDWHQVRGTPFLVRLVEGLRRPKNRFIGGDAAGVVEAVGSAVTHVSPGDEVFGIRTGSFAEYVAGKNFVRKPANLSFEEAAALPIAGVTAYQAVHEHGRLKAGERVLVNGAGGGVGSMAVQIAKAAGGMVTAVTGTATVDMVTSLGADDVVDYSRDDFTRTDRRYDVVIDVGGNRSVRELRRILAPGGRLVLVGAGKGRTGPMTRLVGGIVRKRLLRQKDIAMFMAQVRREELDALRDLAEAGKLRAAIDRSFPLERTAEALRYMEEGKVRGKVVLTV